jgi:glycosyltransferase involved in cell wall biosynthesis
LTLKKKCLVLVSNDLTFDQRVRKTCDSMLSEGYQIELVGVRKSKSHDINRTYKTTRLRVFFSKGWLFYAMLNLRLFFYILFRSYDVVWSNDLDTLLPAAMLKRLKKYALIYDSHEYFTEAEGLTGRDSIKKIWERIERYAVPKADVFITVNESIAKIYSTKYARLVHVLRNMPNANSMNSELHQTLLELPNQFVLLQGAYIDPDRGGMELVSAFEYIDSKKLVVVGAGRDLPNMKRLVNEKGLNEKVHFIDRLPPEELRELTKRAWLGVSLDKPVHLNYTLSLPNKIFDYIHAEIPVLVSPLVELKRIVEEYQVGIVLTEVTPNAIAQAILGLSDEERLEFCKNAKKAKQSLTWESDMNDVLVAIKKQIPH